MENFFVIIFGIVMGSFINVVGLRYQSGFSINGRSRCMHCNKKLSSRELIPIVSYLIQKGRCVSCKSKLSLQYIVVELWMALLYFSFYLAYGFSSNFWIYSTVFSIYTIIAIYDFRHMIIPDFLSILSILISGLKPIFFANYSLMDWLAGPILGFIFFMFWAISRGRVMGLGDAKLTLSVGLLLGANTGFSAIILSFWTGALFGFFLIFKNRIYPLLMSREKNTIKSEIPFAPFIILGAWIATIFKLNLLQILL